MKEPFGVIEDRLTQEQEADFFGQAMAKYVGSIEVPPNFFAISGVGGVVILSALWLVRQMRPVLATGQEETAPSDTHPPLAERIEVILAVHEREDEQTRVAYTDMCNCFREFFNILWEHLKPLCLAEHERGTRPVKDVVDAGGWLPLNA